MSKPTGPVESVIQAQIVDYLKSKDIFHFKVVAANINGIPDLVCCHNGRFIGFEVKRNATAPIRPLQLRVKQRIEDSGGDSYIVWSLDMVKEIIETYEC